MLEEFYAEDVTAMPFGLFVRTSAQNIPKAIAYPWAFYVYARQWLGLRPNVRYGSGPIGSGRTISRHEIPPRTYSRWSPHLEYLGDAGFTPLEFRLPDVIGARESVSGVFLNKEHTTFATLEWIRMEGDGIEESLPIEFNSFFADDPELMTGLLARNHLILAEMLQIEFVDAEFLNQTLGPIQGYRRHIERMRTRTPLTFPVESALGEFRNRSRRRFDWALEKKFLRRLSPKEVDVVRNLRLPSD